jgi:flagellar protein FlaG
MSVEVDAINADKVFKLMYKQLQNNNNVSEDNDADKLTDEEIKKIINSEIPDMEKVIEDLNRIADQSDILDKRVKLSFNKEINRVIIRIVDKQSNRIIKEIPFKEIQNLAIHLRQAIGILYDNNA